MKRLQLSDASTPVRRGEWKSQGERPEAIHGSAPGAPRGRRGLSVPWGGLLSTCSGLVVSVLLSADSFAFERHAPPDPLWPSPFGEVLIYESGNRDPNGQLRSAPSIPGATFSAGRGLLTRIEVELHDRVSAEPVVFRIWTWRESRAATLRSPPLFEDRIAMGLSGSWKKHSVFPRISSEEDRLLYFELFAENRPPFRARAVHRISAPDTELLSSRDQAARIWFRAYRHSPVSDAVLPDAFPKGHSFSWLPRVCHARVGTDDHLERIREYADATTPGLLKGCGRSAHVQSFLEAFLYSVSCESAKCDENRASRAVELLKLSDRSSRCDFGDEPRARSCTAHCTQDAGGTAFRWLEDPSSAYQLLRTSPTLSVSDHFTIRSLLLRRAREYWPLRWRGSFNRSALAAAGYARLATLFPDAPDAPSWRRYASDVFSDIWRSMETEEDSASYSVNAWLPGVLQLAQALGRSESLWKDVRFRTLIDRFADQILPLGFIPGFGDGSGFGVDSPSLLWVLEEAAARLQEPRYRWLADRIYRYNGDHACDNRKGRDSWERDLRNLARAWRSADKSISIDVPSSLPSVVTYRHAAMPRNPNLMGQPPTYADFDEKLVPERLILRSGPSENDMAAVFNLLAGYRHGHESIGGLSVLTQQGSVLMTETAIPYFRHQSSIFHESTAIVQRFWGGSPKSPGRSVSLDRFDEGSRVTVAWFSWMDSSGWGVRQSRRIYFLKNRALWIRDEFSLPPRMQAAVGVVWHAGALAEKRGSTWFNVSSPHLFNNIWRYRNREYYAHLYLMPPATGKVLAEYRREYGAAKECDSTLVAVSPIRAECRFSPPYVIHQHKTIGDASNRNPVFDTVIVPSQLPSNPNPDADHLEIRLAHPSVEVTALALTIEGESWLLLENSSHETVDFNGVTTDGDYIIIERRPPHAPYIATNGAHLIEIDGASKQLSPATFCETLKGDVCAPTD